VAHLVEETGAEEPRQIAGSRGVETRRRDRRVAEPRAAQVLQRLGMQRQRVHGLGRARGERSPWLRVAREPSARRPCLAVESEEDHAASHRDECVRPALWHRLLGGRCPSLTPYVMLLWPTDGGRRQRVLDLPTL
jgi:hypothetical protein